MAMADPNLNNFWAAFIKSAQTFVNNSFPKEEKPEEEKTDLEESE